MNCYEATIAKIGHAGQPTETTRTILVGGNSLRHAAVKAEEATSNVSEELVKLELTDKVIL